MRAAVSRSICEGDWHVPQSIHAVGRAAKVAIGGTIAPYLSTRLTSP